MNRQLIEDIDYLIESNAISESGGPDNDFQPKEWTETFKKSSKSMAKGVQKALREFGFGRVNVEVVYKNLDGRHEMLRFTFKFPTEEGIDITSRDKDTPAATFKVEKIPNIGEYEGEWVFEVPEPSSGPGKKRYWDKKREDVNMKLEPRKIKRKAYELTTQSLKQNNGEAFIKGYDPLG